MRFTTSSASTASRSLPPTLGSSSVRINPPARPLGRAAPRWATCHVKWAFSEAAVLFLRPAPGGKKRLGEIAQKHGKGKALSMLAHKIGRAVVYLLSRGTVFSMEKFRAA